MHPSALISANDVRRFMGKRKLTANAWSSRGSKKSQPNVPLVTAHPTNTSSTVVGRTNVLSVAVSGAAGEVVIALVALVTLP